MNHRVSDEIDRPDAFRLAALAHLGMSVDERARFERDIGPILAHMRDLATVDISAVSAESDLKPALLRSDDEIPSLRNADALREAPKSDEGGFAVPAFVDEG
jgi:aspartyl-tRNA(Asn)/glutamyl-tRNA(Gln) amidotransferase subunit C